MKNLVLITIIALLSFNAYADPVLTDYVVTKDGITYFVKLRYGANAYLVGKNTDGTKVRFAREEILSFRKSGIVYQKKSMDHSKCEECEFLQLLRTRHGFSIYMYQKTNIYGDPVKQFYVYKGDQFVLEIDEDNYNQMIEFFSRKYN